MVRRFPSVVSLGFLVLLLNACDRSGIDLAAEKDALEEIALELVAAEASRDLEAVMSYWSEGAVAQINGVPQVNGKDAIRELMHSMLSSFKEFEGTTTHIEMASSGDFAYEYGVNRLVFTAEEVDLLAMGKYLAVWRKIDGSWRLAALSVTNDEAVPIPIEVDDDDA